VTVSSAWEQSRDQLAHLLPDDDFIYLVEYYTALELFKRTSQVLILTLEVQTRQDEFAEVFLEGYEEFILPTGRRTREALKQKHPFLVAAEERFFEHFGGI
jgi:hypothetical protein